jgi:dGTP triphosphohydrolase
VSGRYQYTYDNNTYEAQRREEERRAEERRIQEEREAQRRIIQAQIESIKGTIKPQLAGLDQSLQTVEIEVQQNLTRAYTAMQASAGQVTANLADAFQVMEQGVKQAMTQYVQRSQQSINQFQQSLAATTENRTAQAQQAIKQATLMVSRLQPLQAYDTMGLMNPIQKALAQAEVMASTSPQAATTAAVQVLQQTFQTASTLEVARAIDLGYKGQIQELIARLGPKIDATKKSIAAALTLKKIKPNWSI